LQQPFELTGIAQTIAFQAKRKASIMTQDDERVCLVWLRSENDSVK